MYDTFISSDFDYNVEEDIEEINKLISNLDEKIEFINGRVEIMGEKLNIKTPYNFILSSIVRQKELVF